MQRRYLAYGSNMCIAQMAERCPAAVVERAVELAGWRFAINRRGVATLLRDPGARAAGVIWRLTPACEAALDRYEGVDAGYYRKAEVEEAGAFALVYLAAEARPGMPRSGYLERILAAVEAHGFGDAIRADLAAWGRPVVPGLLREVLSGYALDPEGIHGVGHWLRVRANGLALAARTPGADAVVVELFALLHDSRRLDEDRDIGHGERAADYARQLAREGVLRLEPARLETLADACVGHEHGRVSRDPTIGCCWDADRLELSRLGRRPKARYLSTDAALEPALQADAWQRGTTYWHDEAGAAAWALAEADDPGSALPLRHASARP